MIQNITALFTRYNFILKEKFESEQITLEYTYQEQQVTCIYCSDNEIYLIGEQGLFSTSLQVEDRAETIASLPYALKQIQQHIQQHIQQLELVA